MTDSQPSWIGRSIGGRYQIEDLLGRGGMSSVYKATDPNLQRAVAVKMIHPHLSEHPEFVKRFEQEAAAVAQLRHPNIIQVHDFNHEGDVYYMILEHVPGETLEKRLDALKGANLRLPLSETIHIMSNLCDAVAFAHERNMVHRDLKPSNVIINLLSEPILMDFGIAKIVGGGQVQTATGATIGTAAYMAPEQVQGENVDQRADIYSLGVMLFEMASGRPPYEGKSALTVMMKHVQEPIPDIRVLNNNIPDILVGILEKALAKDPADRFSSAIEIGTALRMVGQQTLESTAAQTFSFPQTAVPKSETAVIPPASPDPTPTSPPTSQPTPAAEQVQPEPAQPDDQPAAAIAPRRSRRKLMVGVAAAVFLIGLLIGGFFLYQRLFPSMPSSADMVQIPAGSYTVGQGNGGNQYAAEQQVDLLDYWIDQYEVSNSDYAAFVADTNADLPSNWSSPTGPSGQEQNPVQGISWEMARDYCNWTNKRLPTEAEWEVAARGPSSLLYPWGDDRQLVTLPTSGSYAAGTNPVNRSAFNVYDMAGNVWEWVDAPYTAVSAGQQVLRGGAYDNQRDMAYRLAGDPTVPTMQVTAGFRCAATEVEVVPEEGILLQEDFVDPESGWESWDDGSVLYGYHPPDYYHVQAGKPNTLSTANFGGTFDDLTMEALVFVDATDTEAGDFRYGMTLRRTGDNFYAFTIAPRAGSWSVLRNTASGLEVLDQGSIDSLQGLTGKDSLRVDASGSQFAFSINGRLVSQFKDAELPEGDIGFLVQTFDETRAHVHFDRLTVREVAYSPTTTVMMSDDFTDPNSGWPSVTEGATLSGYHPPDYYHVQSGEPAHRSVAYFEGTLDDFTMEADIFVDSTDTPDGDFRYGLIARRQGDDFYAFLVSPQTGEWRVIKNSATGEDLLAEGVETSAQGLTAVNRLRVDAEGQNLIFHVNGRPLILIEDDSYSEGDIGFIVETLDQPRAHVHYDAFTLREVDADLAAAPTTTTGAANPAAASTSAPTAEPVPESPSEPTAEPTPQPSLPTAAGMVLVDGGTYDVGDNTAVALETFWLDQTETTNAQFTTFLDATGQTSSASAGVEDHPVRGVTWDEAAAYCQWTNKRLPTEAEWVAAARGPHGWLYPWGDNETAVSLPTSGTYPVGSIPANHSIFGAFDMAGNVWEWVDAPFLPTSEGQRVLRGGAYSFQQDLTQRLPGDPTSSVMTTDAGFRCAASEAEAAGADSSQLLHDEFADLNSGWWQARAPAAAYFYGYHPSDFYHVQVSADNDCLTVNHELTLDNFMAEFEIFTASTDTESGSYRYGLTMRHSDQAFYAFTISPRSQGWQIFKSSSRGLQLMAEGESGSIRGDSQATRNRLFVIANGPEMTFFVNGELVSRVVDDEYENGRLGFIVNTLDETYAHIHYDAVTVWELPTTTAAPEGLVNTAVSSTVEPLCRGSVVAEDALVSFISHTVVEGETLSSIALEYNVTPEEIMGANGKSIIVPSLIQTGQVLVIPQT